MSTIRIARRAGHDDLKDAGYFSIPFTVEAGTTRIEVSVDFGAADPNDPDFGLTDPSLSAFPSPTGFRGWSAGTKRRKIFTATDDATPGYHYGPIPAGEWRFVIGLDKIPAAGADIVLVIELDDSPRAVAPQPARATPVRRGAGWYRGDLHTHTYHSDADGSPEVLHQAAVQAGLDFLGVADHNTVTQRRYFNPASSADMIFVRAMEVTTGEGHANVYGVDDIVDFRMHRPGDAHVLAADVRRRGGILSVNHDKPTIPWNYEFPDSDCMEVWQSPWLEGNWISLARYQQRLASGRRLSAIGGSDYHQPETVQPDGPFVLARPTTVLYLDALSEAQILEAIRAGRGYITESPAGPHLSISADGASMGSHVVAPRSVVAEIRGAAGDRLVWVDASGVVEEQDIGNSDWSASLSNRNAIKGFIRAEIVARASRDRLLAEFAPKRDQVATLGHSLEDLATQPIRRALSNPIYVG